MTALLDEGRVFEAARLAWAAWTPGRQTCGRAPTGGERLEAAASAGQGVAEHARDGEQEDLQVERE